MWFLYWDTYTTKSLSAHCRDGVVKRDAIYRCAEDAGRCLMFRSGGSIPVRVTSCEPVGEPVIEARSPSCRPAGGQEMVSILGRLQEKARFRADGDVLAICVARMRLRDAFGGE